VTDSRAVNRPSWGLLGLLVVLLAGALLAAPPAAAPAAGAPRVVVLGTAQDGGVPQIGCSCARCVAARRDPARRRRVASLAIWSPAADRVDLVDATPDIGDQVEAIHRLRAAASRHASRTSDRHPVESIFLTHAHIGHYLGLAELGFEALNGSAISTFCSSRMAHFLETNAPWDLLLRRRNIVLHELVPGRAEALSPGVSVEPLVVPHRAEYTDTLGFLIRGPRTTLLYVPDTDGWQQWPRPLTAVLDSAHVGVALLDGTFSSDDELGDRSVRRIGHPLIRETMDLLESRVRGGRLRVYFTHFNHSNPVLDPAGAAGQAVAARGFHLLAEGQEIEL
jgi:pyrroloquinoline quinone biosynthesis protein B